MRYLLLVLISLVGCKSQQQTPEVEIVISTPLPFDPTEEYVLAEWWSNDQQLLHLDESGAYKLYEGTNRYGQTAERGRWWQRSYAVLWLEPYTLRAQDPTRVAIRKSDDGFSIHLRDLQEMKALDEPPVVLEDKLFGTWSGVFGTLMLTSDSRYVYSPVAPLQEMPAVLAGHHGQWRVQEKMVLLIPDSPSLEPIALSVNTSDEKTLIATPDGALERVAFPGRGKGE